MCDVFAPGMNVGILERFSALQLRQPRTLHMLVYLVNEYTTNIDICMVYIIKEKHRQTEMTNRSLPQRNGI